MFVERCFRVDQSWCYKNKILAAWILIVFSAPPWVCSCNDFSYLFQEDKNIKRAMDFLQESRDLLKIEDILPFFPDFVTIDHFKDALCESLAEYNKQIDRLKVSILAICNCIYILICQVFQFRKHRRDLSVLRVKVPPTHIKYRVETSQEHCLVQKQFNPWNGWTINNAVRPCC